MIKISCNIETAIKLTAASILKRDLRRARILAITYYLENLIENHFRMISPNLRYKPNKITYEQWKRKYHPDAVYQLVLSGRLRNAVLRGKVDGRNAKVTFNIPEYGIYQIRADRDFLEPTFGENMIIQAKTRTNLRKLRQRTIRAR